MHSDSSEHFSKTFATIESGLAQGVAPGFVVGVWTAKRPDAFWAHAWGNRRMIPSPLPLTTETLFDIVS